MMSKTLIALLFAASLGLIVTPGTLMADEGQAPGPCDSGPYADEATACPEGSQEYSGSGDESTVPEDVRSLDDMPPDNGDADGIGVDQTPPDAIPDDPTPPAQ